MTRRLRILELIAASTNDLVQGNRVWLRNLYEPLVELGHDVVLLPAEDGRSAMIAHDSKAREAFGHAVLKRFKREHSKQPFDLFFGYLMDGMIDHEVIDEIRSLGVPACNFSCNNVHQFNLVSGLSPHFDFCLHSERDVGEKFREIGATPLWWPMASNPRFAHPMSTAHEYMVSFVGGNYGVRAEYALHLIENSIDLHVFGPRWTLPNRRARARREARRDLTLARALLARSLPAQSRATAEAARVDTARRLAIRYSGNVHEPVSDDEVIRLYSSSRVSLGFLEVFDGHDPSRSRMQHIHLREFEAPMSGALYLTNYSDELAELFEPDKEVLVWRDRFELLDKARFYSTHPDAGRAIRLAGRERALACHTYERRFLRLFMELGLQ